MTEEQPNPDKDIRVTPQQAQIAIAAALPIHVAEAKDQAGPLIDALENGGYTELTGVIRRIWDGERDYAALRQGLDEEDAATVSLILDAVNDPRDLQKLLEASEKLSQSEHDHGEGHHHGHDHHHGEEGDHFSPQHAKVLLTAAIPAHHPETRSKAEPLLASMEGSGHTALPAAIRRIWDGERDSTALTQGLEKEDAFFIGIVLHAVEDEKFLEGLMKAADGPA